VMKEWLKNDGELYCPVCGYTEPAEVNDVELLS